MTRYQRLSQFLLTLTLLLLCSLFAVQATAQTGIGIEFTADPGQTCYARVKTSASTSIAIAAPEGTDGAVGFYYVTNSALQSAGLSTAISYSWKGFIGSSPSTTANDQWIASGQVKWGGTAAVEVGTGAITADSIAADAIGASELAADAIGSSEWAGTTTTEVLQFAVPATNTANTIGDCLNSARAQAVGKWSLNATTRVLTIYSSDGTTAIGNLLIGPNLGNPLTRTPQ